MVWWSLVAGNTPCGACYQAINASGQISGLQLLNDKSLLVTIGDPVDSKKILPHHPQVVSGDPLNRSTTSIWLIFTVPLFHKVYSHMQCNFFPHLNRWFFSGPLGREPLWPNHELSCNRRSRWIALPMYLDGDHWKPVGKGDEWWWVMKNEVCLGLFLNSKRYNVMGRMVEFVCGVAVARFVLNLKSDLLETPRVEKMMMGNVDVFWKLFQSID